MSRAAQPPSHSGRSFDRRRVLAGGVAAALAGSMPAPAKAVEVCDLLLALSADVSRSVDATKFKLQREGYAAAISDPRVMRLIEAPQAGNGDPNEPPFFSGNLASLARTLQRAQSVAITATDDGRQVKQSVVYRLAR